MSDKKIIQDLQQKMLKLKWQIDAILDKHLGEDEGQWHIIGEWDCQMSPIGLCIYHPFTDPAKDHCIYCDCPSERK